MSSSAHRIGFTAICAVLLATAAGTTVAGSCESDYRDLLLHEGSLSRHEVPESGLAISFPEDWIVERAAPDATRTEALRLEPILTADPPDAGSLCTVYATTDEAPWPSGTFPDDEDHGSGDPAWVRAEALMRPLMEELGHPAGFTIGYAVVPGPVLVSFREPEGSLFVGYHLPDADGDFILACQLHPWGPRGERSVVGWPCDPIAASWSVLPIAESFEVLPTEE